MRSTFLCLPLLLLASSAPGIEPPGIPFDPEHYVIHRAGIAVVVDGRLNDEAWRAAPWTQPFVDIQGALQPDPHLDTRAKMLWDDEHFYIGATLEEPHVWGKLTERDAVIYYDNDLEVFIDPDGDTHDYFELEINALGTEWDLFLTKPYRDDGSALHAWDIPGLRSAIHVDGTLNDPGDTDRGWSVEIAIPWGPLAEGTRVASPPVAGDQWRINFSRVQWRTRVENGDYVKLTDPETGKSLPEDNWVWSPQGLINMHYPERWGYVQFAERGGDEFRVPDDGAVRTALFDLYYAQRSFEDEHGRFAASVEELGLSDLALPVTIHTGPGFFVATTPDSGTDRFQISQDGRFQRLPPR